MFTTPGLTAVTRPVGLMVATDGLPLVQEPPVGVTINVPVMPTHNMLLPVITGTGFTETVYTR